MSIRRITGVAATTAAMVGAMIAVGSPAQAATSACTNTGAGSLCITVDPAGYDASYHKISGAAAYVDFNLVCGSKWYGDKGAFWISAGQVKTYTFAVGSLGSCKVKLIDKNTGSTWLTPAVSR